MNENRKRREKYLKNIKDWEAKIDRIKKKAVEKKQHALSKTTSSDKKQKADSDKEKKRLVRLERKIDAEQIKLQRLDSGLEEGEIPAGTDGQAFFMERK